MIGRLGAAVCRAQPARFRPPKGFTFRWWRAAFHSEGARDALIVSLKTATGATLVALILGLLAALAVHRFAFFGRESLNLMIVLPIWIFRNLSRGEQQPIVTVVATAVMLMSVIPVWVAQRLTSDDGPLSGGPR